jgi:DUF4097 and DUF4098 domain-containing protein YvlB
MRRLLIALCAIALFSPTAFAQDGKCKHTASRDLKLDIGDARAVVFEIGPHDLRLTASPKAPGRVQGRACASDPKALEDLLVTQERVGDKLVVRAGHKDRRVINLFGSYYAYLELEGTVPDDVMVQLKVGSGDAWVTGASALSVDTGSGDVEAKRIRGAVTAKVNSGDIVLDDIGSLHVLSVGSGDLSVERVRGAVEVGSIGSGDFELDGAQGGVEIDSIGSGDAGVSDIGGDVRVGSIGSGDFNARDVRGGLTVRSVGSGSVEHSGIDGAVDVPKHD